MLDAVVSAFEADKRLGVVFPEDPYLIGWGQNRLIAEELANRMGISDPLPNHFEFPVGTEPRAALESRPVVIADLGLAGEKRAEVL